MGSFTLQEILMQKLDFDCVRTTLIWIFVAKAAQVILQNLEAHFFRKK